MLIADCTNAMNKCHAAAVAAELFTVELMFTDMTLH